MLSKTPNVQDPKSISSLNGGELAIACLPRKGVRFSSTFLTRCTPAGSPRPRPGLWCLGCAVASDHCAYAQPQALRMCVNGQHKVVKRLAIAYKFTPFRGRQAMASSPPLSDDQIFCAMTSAISDDHSSPPVSDDIDFSKDILTFQKIDFKC